MNISKSINIARANAEINQKDLSLIIGVSQQFLSGLSTGRLSASITMIERLAKSMDYSVSEFIALGEEKAA